MVLNKLFIVIISASAFILSFATVWQFVVFLSSHDILRYYRFKHVGAASQEIQYQYSSSVLWAATVDVILVLLFVGHHSVMTRRSIKERLNQLSLGMLARSLYVIGTCLTLQILMKYWHPLLCGALWEIDTVNHPFWWWLFVLTHTAAWVVVYGGSVMMDLPEMLGVKQVYYHVQGLPSPLTQKSAYLVRLYSHLRHPSFSALTLILWFHPIMRIDRFLLASGLTLYMLIAFRPDNHDYRYQQEQLERKKVELALL